MTAIAAPAAATGTSTADAFARYVADDLVAPWPGGTLLARPVAAALAATVTRIHAQTSMLARSATSFDRWLALMAGAPDGSLSGDALARQAADLFVGMANRVARPPAQLAATALPPPAGTFPSPMPAPTPPVAAGFTPPASWNPDGIRRALLRLGKIGALELASLPPRLAVANAIAGTALVLPGIRSTRQVGNVVHPILQGRYRAGYAPPNLVVTDRRVYGGFGPMAMPVTGTRLSEAIGTANPQLVTLYLSSLDQELIRSIKRTDVTDFGRLANWEIKPVLSAPIGVMQEAWYRCAYNWMAGEFANQIPALAAELAPLRPGPVWDLSLLDLIYVPPVGGQPAAAIPFTTMTLPGMVLYIVASGPTMVDLALLALLMLRLIEREAQRRLQQAEAAVKVILQVLIAELELFLNALFDALKVMVILLVLAGLAAAFVLVELPAAAGAAVVVLVVGGALYIIEQLRRGGQSPPGSDDPTRITLDFPGVSVRLPAQDAGLFCAAAELMVADAFRAFHDHVGGQLGDAATV